MDDATVAASGQLGDLLAYDYSLVPEEHRAAVIGATLKIKVYGTMASSAVAQMGLQLKNVKSCLPYGQWGRWLATEFRFSERTAQRYMRVCEYALKEGVTVSELDGFELSSLYTLAEDATPAEVRNSAIEAVQDGQRVVRRYVQEALGKRLRPAKPLVGPERGGDGPPEPPPAVRWPALSGLPRTPAAEFAAGVPAGARKHAKALAEAWSQWLDDVAADLSALEEDERPRPAQAPAMRVVA